MKRKFDSLIQNSKYLQYTGLAISTFLMGISIAGLFYRGKSLASLFSNANEYGFVLEADSVLKFVMSIAVFIAAISVCFFYRLKQKKLEVKFKLFSSIFLAAFVFDIILLVGLLGFSIFFGKLNSAAIFYTCVININIFILGVYSFYNKLLELIKAKEDVKVPVLSINKLNIKNLTDQTVLFMSMLVVTVILAGFVLLGNPSESFVILAPAAGIFVAIYASNVFAVQAYNFSMQLKRKSRQKSSRRK